MLVLDHREIGATRHMEGWQALIRAVEAQHLRVLSEHLFRDDMGKDAVKAVHELLDDLITELKRVAAEPDA